MLVRAISFFFMALLMSACGGGGGGNGSVSMNPSWSPLMEVDVANEFDIENSDWRFLEQAELSDGSWLVVFSSADNYIASKVYGEGINSGPRMLGPALPGSKVQLQPFGNGAMLIWKSDDQDGVLSTIYDPVTGWGASETVFIESEGMGRAEDIRLITNDAGHAFVAATWVNENFYSGMSLLCKYYLDGKWSNQLILQAAGASAQTARHIEMAPRHQQAMAMNEDGNVVLGWREVKDKEIIAQQAVYIDLNVGRSTEPFAFADSTSDYLAVAIDAEGVGYAFSVKADIAIQAAHYQPNANSSVLGSWDTPLNIYSTVGTFSLTSPLAAAKGNTVVLAWHEVNQSNHHAVHVMHENNGEWIRHQLASAGEVHGIMVDRQGVPFVLHASIAALNEPHCQLQTYRQVAGVWRDAEKVWDRCGGSLQYFAASGNQGAVLAYLKGIRHLGYLTSMEFKISQYQ